MLCPSGPLSPKSYTITKPNHRKLRWNIAIYPASITICLHHKIRLKSLFHYLSLHYSCSSLDNLKMVDAMLPTANVLPAPVVPRLSCTSLVTSALLLDRQSTMHHFLHLNLIFGLFCLGQLYYSELYLCNCHLITAPICICCIIWVIFVIADG